MKIKLTPWLGQNNIWDEYDLRFTPTSERQVPVTAAVNVDWDVGGKAYLRPGSTLAKAGTAYKSAFPFGSHCLIQDGGTLYKADTSFNLTSLETGLSSSLAFEYVEYGGQVYMTNSEVCRRFTSAGNLLNWGMTVPPVATLGTTAGSLDQATYRVTCTLVDASGVESGAPKAAELTTSGAITVDLSSMDSNATHVNIYAARGDLPELYWNQKVAVGALPATITDVQVSDRVLRNKYLRGPIPGSNVFSHFGYLMLCKDNFVFRSRGQAPHLFHPRSEILTFPSDVQGGGSVRDGFYIATSGGLFWISGSEPVKWFATRKDDTAYAKGMFRFPGRYFPELNTDDTVVAFGYKGGVAFGLPSGIVRYVTHDRLRLASTPSQISMLYRENNAIHQLLMLGT